MVAALLLAAGSLRQGLVNGFRTPVEMTEVHSSMARTRQAPGRGLEVTFQPSEWPNVSLLPPAPWDWSAAGAVAIDLTNPGKEPVAYGVRIDDDPKADGWNHSRSISATLAPGKTETVVVVLGPEPRDSGMRGLPPYPGGHSLSASGAGPFDRRHIVSMQVFMHRPSKETTLFLSNIRTMPPISTDGIVDAFGQYTRSDWPGKVHRAADFAVRRAEEEADLRKHPVPSDRDRFGGWAAGPSLPATGFFSTAKRDGKWWLVDPDGRLFFSFGIDTMTPDETTFVTGREAMFTWMPKPGDPLSRFRFPASSPFDRKFGDAFNFYGANLYRKYGSGFLTQWRRTATDRLRSWGFDTIGNWSDEALERGDRAPYVASGGIGGDHAKLGSGSDYWGPMHDPFDPRFVRDVETSLAPLAEKVKNDPWCLGYFVDNELSWSGDGPDGRYGLAIGALKAPAGSPAKAALVSQLKAHYSDIGSLNAAWVTQFSSWESLETPLTLPGVLNDAQRRDFSTFVHALALRYFQTVRDTLHRLDPHHLYLGCRFAWYGPEAERAAAEVCDVVSYNVYASSLDPVKWNLARLNKPCIVGEFHFGALDRGMFHPGLVSTPNQTARAAMYEAYVTSVLRNPSFVGCHWFQYTDEPLTGRSWDGENYNIGFVSVTDTPYPEMVAAARRVQSDGYRIRSKP